jgi:demethylmenaquinone methyltransferase/2-methoxy-6-polyprenyl-1,4-benzoquinol methylase
VSSSSQQVKPYQSESSKREQIEEMFDGISGKYDFLNHFLSLGIDKIWRKKAVKEIAEGNPTRILDVATGTADLAIASRNIGAEEIVGVDISEKMLAVGRQKIAKMGLKRIHLENGDSEDLPFDDGSFDAISVAFGVRNFEHLEKGLTEMRRVLKKGGKLVILEFSQPSAFPIKQFYNLYNKTVLPLAGKIFAGSKEAYTYLPASVMAFPEGQSFLNILEAVGYQKVKQNRLSFGICTLYTAFN